MLDSLGGANTHRHECKLPTFKGLRNILKSFLVAFFFYFMNEKNGGKKQLLVLSLND